MSWTLQIQHHTQMDWVNWSGYQAYKDLDSALAVYLKLHHRTANWHYLWNWRVIDLDTSEIIPVEALGL